MPTILWVSDFWVTPIWFASTKAVCTRSAAALRIGTVPVARTLYRDHRRRALILVEARHRLVRGADDGEVAASVRPPGLIEPGHAGPW